MFTTTSRLVAPHLTFHNDPRSARLAHERRRLEKSLFDLVRTKRSTMALGKDPLVVQLAAAKGFKADDLVVLRIAVRTRLATVVCVPTRLWKDPASKQMLLELKREAKALRTNCLLLPQSCVRGNLRANNARLLARALQVSCSERERRSVLDHVREARICTIGEAASALSHDDPIGVVLHLCAVGEILIDRSSGITAETWIYAKID